MSISILLDPNNLDLFCRTITPKFPTPGPTGEKGATGEKGDKGDTGNKGDTGDTGAKGDKGDTGDKGDKGDTGNKGDTGDTGPNGINGDTGDKGDKGDTGNKGDTGDTGPNGINGDTGAKGDKGDTGGNGINGINGDTGATGPAGILSVSSIGSAPNANALTLTGTDLKVQPASASFGGVLTTGLQSIGGGKTFINDTNFSQNIILPKSSSTAGVIKVNSFRFLHSTSPNLIPDNVCLGAECANLSMVGTNGVYIGFNTATNLSTGSSNVCIGASAGNNLTNGAQNLLLGTGSGFLIPANAQNCIILNDNGTGTDNNLIRIGTNNLQTKTYISGIKNNIIPDSNLPEFVFMDPTNSQLGSSSSFSYREFLTTAICTIQTGTISTATVNGVSVVVSGGGFNTGLLIRCIKIGKKVTIYVPSILVNSDSGSNNLVLFLSSFSPALPASSAFQEANIVTVNAGNIVTDSYVLCAAPTVAFNFVFSANTNPSYGFQTATSFDYFCTI